MKNPSTIDGPAGPGTAEAAAGATGAREVLTAVGILALLAAGVFADGALRAALLVSALSLGAVAPFPGLLAIALAVWTLPLMKMPAVVSDIRADELLLFAVAAGVLVRIVGRRDWRPGVVVRAFGVFLAAMVASVALKYAFGYDVALRAVALPVVRQVMRLVLFAVAAYLLEGRSARFAALGQALMGGAVAAALLGIVQYHSASVHAWVAATFPTLDGAATYPYVPGGPGFRSMSTFDGNPNHFGVAIVMMALFASVMAHRAGVRTARWAWASGAVLLLSAVLFTTSRTAFLVAVGALVLAVVLLRSRIPALVLAAWFAVMAVVPNLMPRRVMDLLGTRTETGVVVPDPSVSGRVEMIDEGVGGTAQVLPIHDNFYVDLFQNFGLLAVFGFLWLLWQVGSRLLRFARSADDTAGYGAAGLLVWVTLALVSFTGGFFATQRVTEIAWLLVAMAFAWHGHGREATAQAAGA